MKRVYFLAALALASFLCVPQLAKADDIPQTIGNALAITPGAVLGAATFNTDVGGQPAPFDKIYGGPNSNFSESWTFNSYIIPAGDTLTAATITIGLWMSPLSTNTSPVASFILDGTYNLTALLNTEVGTVGSGKNTYEVYTISLTDGALAALASGSAMFSLSLQGPGNGVLAGGTPDLAGGLAFSTLDMTGQSGSSTVPEPSTLALLLIGIAGLRSKRLSRNQS